MKIINFLPTNHLFGESTAHRAATELKATFQKRYTFQLLIWVVAKKMHRTLEVFLADEENQRTANLAARRAAKKQETILIAGCTVFADSRNTTVYDYAACEDPEIISIYEAQAVLKSREIEREKKLRGAAQFDRLPVSAYSVEAVDGEFFTIKMLPKKRTHDGVRVMLPEAAN